MSIQWRDRLSDLLSVPYFNLGITRDKRQVVGASGPQVPEKPYQSPGKDKNHPGDETATQSSTERSAGSIDGMKFAAGGYKPLAPHRNCDRVWAQSPADTRPSGPRGVLPEALRFQPLTDTLLRMSGQKYQVPDQSPAGPGLASSV